MIGNPVPYKQYKPSAVRFVAAYNKEDRSVDRSDKHKFKKDEGNLSVPLSGVPLGNYWLQFEFEVMKTSKESANGEISEYVELSSIYGE